MQWKMADELPNLTPVIISMCQLMANDRSDSSVVQGPGSSSREKMSNIIKKCLELPLLKAP